MSKAPPASVPLQRFLGKHLGSEELEETAILEGKPIRVRWTPRARKALSTRTTPLYVEMKLTLACLPKKEVFFHEQPSDQPVAFVNDRLAVWMNLYIPAACAMPDYRSRDDDTLPQGKRGAFTVTPQWLTLDFDGKEWMGEYRI